VSALDLIPDVVEVVLEEGLELVGVFDRGIEFRSAPDAAEFGPVLGDELNCLAGLIGDVQRSSDQAEPLVAGAEDHGADAIAAAVLLEQAQVRVPPTTQGKRDAAIAAMVAEGVTQAPLGLAGAVDRDGRTQVAARVEERELAVDSLRARVALVDVVHVWEVVEVSVLAGENEPGGKRAGLALGLPGHVAVLVDEPGGVGPVRVVVLVDEGARAAVC